MFYSQQNTHYLYQYKNVYIIIIRLKIYNTYIFVLRIQTFFYALAIIISEVLNNSY